MGFEPKTLSFIQTFVRSIKRKKRITQWDSNPRHLGYVQIENIHIRILTILTPTPFIFFTLFSCHLAAICELSAFIKLELSVIPEKKDDR